MAETKKDTKEEMPAVTTTPSGNAAANARAEMEPGEGQKAGEKLAKGKGGDKEYDVAERASTVQRAFAEPQRPLASPSDESDSKERRSSKESDKADAGVVKAAGEAVKEAVDKVVANAPRSNVPTRTYRLISGKHFLADGSRLAVGGTTELTDAQAWAMADRFVLEESADAAKKGLKDRQDTGTGGRPIPTTHIPQDAGSKTPIHLDEGIITPQQTGGNTNAAGAPSADGTNTASRQAELDRNEKTKS